jgi:signal transduction histidine kinase/ligand-binding sensor domain-containing protein
MRFFIYSYHIIFLFLTVSQPVFCQKEERKRLLKYTQQNGLSSYNIRKIVQDTYGFTWVATQDGLNRFDGINFTEYNKNVSVDKHKLIAADCRDLFLDTAKKKLWVLANEGGLNVIDYRTGRVEETIIRKSHNSDDWAISFEFANNRLWIGTGNGLTIFNTETKQFEKSPLDSVLSGLSSAKSQIRFCKKDKFNNIWACINGVGIAIINSQTQKIIKILPVNEMNDHTDSGIIQFYSATEVSDMLLFGTSQGLRLFAFDRNYTMTINNTPCKSLPVLNTASINWIGRSPDDRLYISSGGFFSITTSLYDPISYKEPSNSTSDWFSDISDGYFIKNNLLFLGCKEGLGIMRLLEEPFQSITNITTAEQKLGHVFALWPYSEDSIVAATNSGLHLITNKRKIKSLRNDGFYQNISRFSNDNIIVSNPKGLEILDKHSMNLPLDTYKELKGFKTWEVNSAIKMNDSIFVLGTENFSGILLWNQKAKKVTKVNQSSKPLKLEADIVNTIYKDARKNLWVLSDKAITIINSTLQTSTGLKFKDSLSGLPVGLFFDMCEAKGDYWIATYSTGIIQLDSTYNIKRIFTTKDGLCNSGVYKIFNFDNKKLFITTNNGLSTLNLENYTFNNYYQIDGLHSNAFEEACGVFYNKKIFAGGVNGFTIIDPMAIIENKSPPLLYINRIEIETAFGKIDSTNLTLKKISVPSNFTQAKIYFAALNYINAARTIYSYKIKELHKDWIKLGTQNFITLIGLSPGTYTLQVKAINEDGIESEIKELTLIFLPKWYQTWWFKTLLALSIIAIGYSLYRMRISQLKKEEKIRNQLASDLHDDLGGTLNSVKVYSNLAMMEKENSNHLLKIKEGTQDAIAGVRDLIWVLDDKKDTVQDLLSRINQFAAPLCEANHIKFEQKIDETLYYQKLGKEEKRNLYMILKESVNNSIKYAGCQLIELKVTTEGKKLQFSVRDNGKGFDKEKTKEGNGLKNIAKRAKEIGYKSSIISAAGNGTAIILEKT